MCQHNLPCSIVYAHCLLPGRAFASLYVLLFLEKEAEIGGREYRRVEHALAKTTLFSGFLSTMLLTFLSFSLFLMQQTPRAIVVKCDGSVYDVDVDNQINRFSLHIFSSSQMIGKIAYYFLKRHCLRVRYRTPRLRGYGSCTGLLDTDSRGPVLDSEPR